VNLCSKDALNIRLTAMPLIFTRFALPVLGCLLFFTSCSTKPEKQITCLKLVCQDSILYDVLGEEFGYTWQCRTSKTSTINLIDWGSSQWIEKHSADSFDTVYFSKADTCIQMGLLARDDGYANQYFQSLERSIIREEGGVQTWKFWPLHDSLSWWLVDIQISENHTWPMFSFLHGTPVGVEGKRGSVAFSFMPVSECEMDQAWLEDCAPRDIRIIDLFPPMTSDQDIIRISGKVMSHDDEGHNSGMPGAQIDIFQDYQLMSVIYAGDSGQYNIDLSLDYLYLLEIKSEGKVQKSIEIDSRYIAMSNQSAGFDMGMDISLFDEIPGVDFSILDQPIGKCKYDEMRNSIMFDFEYTRVISDSVNALRSLKTH
jgi:hypothetical protein